MKKYYDIHTDKIYSEEEVNELAEKWITEDKYSLYDYIINNCGWEEVFDGLSKEFMSQVIEDRKKEILEDRIELIELGIKVLSN